MIRPRVDAEPQPPRADSAGSRPASYCRSGDRSKLNWWTWRRGMTALHKLLSEIVRNNPLPGSSRGQSALNVFARGSAENGGRRVPDRHYRRDLLTVLLQDSGLVVSANLLRQRCEFAVGREPHSFRFANHTLSIIGFAKHPYIQNIHPRKPSSPACMTGMFACLRSGAPAHSSVTKITAAVRHPAKMAA